MSLKQKLYKLYYWEFWPVYMFYIPNLFYALYHAAKERSLTFYTLTNPGIENGGIGTESKHKTLHLLPKEYIPKSVLYKKESSLNDLLNQIKSAKLHYPLIAKPDRGFRGFLVQKIMNEEALRTYLNKKSVDMILQEFIPYAKECGIFFIRHPEEKLGRVTSVTLKEFPEVTGDGKQDLRSLYKKDKHLKLFQESIETLSNQDLSSIPKKDEVVQLTSIGNHSKGTKFINGNHLINNELNELFTRINVLTTGWYYGRLDIKYESWESLQNGDFKIIELNGILGEPTHIYDTSTTGYWGALKTIRRHWKKLHAIAAYHHRKGLAYKKSKDLIKELRSLKTYMRKVKALA